MINTFVLRGLWLIFFIAQKAFGKTTQTSQNKNSVRPLSNFTESLDVEQSGDTLHYMITAFVGTPPQDVHLVVDTGSSALMLFDAEYCLDESVGLGCFNSSESETFQNATSGSHFQLRIDGETISSLDQIKFGADTLSFVDPASDEETTLPTTENNSFYLLNNCSVANSSLNLHTCFSTSDGLIGLAYQALSPLNFSDSPFLRIVAPDFRSTDELPTFAFDFNPPDERSAIHLNGIDDSFGDDLIWGSPSVFAKHNRTFHTFDLFSFSVCDVDLFDGSFSSSWPAIIDTGATCLSLPSDYYDRLMAWIPNNCTSFRDVLGSNHYCWLPKELEDSLPTVSFLMEEKGDPLFFNLESLLFDEPEDFDGDGEIDGRGYCIIRYLPVDINDPTPHTPFISFGNRLMHSLYTVFDMDSGQVAFATKDNVKTDSNDQCSTPITCEGQETFDITLNICIPPKCEAFYFYTMDQKTKTCVLSPKFVTGGIVVICSIIGAELFLNELKVRLSRKVVNDVRLM